jgi:hypothetical protein
MAATTTTTTAEFSPETAAKGVFKKKEALMDAGEDILFGSVSQALWSW